MALLLRGSLRLIRWVAVAVFSVVTTPWAFAAQEWSAPVHVSADDIYDSYEDGETRLAVDDAGNVVVVWLRSLANYGIEPQVTVASSFDGGATFNRPAQLSDLDFTPHGLEASQRQRDGVEIPVTAVDVVYAGNNTWVAMWIKPAEAADQYDVRLKRSHNNGLTWSQEQELYSGPLNPDNIDLAADKQGNVIATFNTRLLRSADYGATWQPMTEPFAISIDIPYDDASHLKATIATNGNGTWVQAHTVFFSYGLTNYVQILASVSNDNGQSWHETLRKQRIFFIMDHDVAMMGDTAVIAATAISPVVYVSGNSGEAWSEEIDLPQYSGITLGLSLAAGNGHWTLLTTDVQSERIFSYVTADPLNWVTGPERVTIDTATESFGAVAALPGGNALALLETMRDLTGTQGPDADIYATTLNNGGTIPPAGSGPDIAISSGGAPKLKFKSKLQEYKINWKAVATNVGDADAQGFVVRFWLSNDERLDDRDTLLSEQFVKSVRAAKPGKKAKSKKLKLKASIPTATMGYIIAEVVNPAEPADENNFASEYFFTLW